MKERLRIIEEENRVLRADEQRLQEEVKLKRGGEGETLSYVKNIILKYMENPEQQHKVSYRSVAWKLLGDLHLQVLLPVLATLLHFSESEVQKLQDPKRKTGWW